MIYAVNITDVSGGKYKNMEIALKSDTFDKTDIPFTISNEQLNNDNFVDIIVETYTYTVSIDELLTAVESFKKLQERNKSLDKI